MLGTAADDFGAVVWVGHVWIVRWFVSGREDCVVWSDIGEIVVWKCVMKRCYAAYRDPYNVVCGILRRDKQAGSGQADRCWHRQTLGLVSDGLRELSRSLENIENATWQE